MKKTIQIGDKYIPVMKWLEEIYDKEEYGVFMGKLFDSYKKMKDKNIDLIILTELLSKYDMDIYKLIQILESANMQPLQVIRQEPVIPIKNEAVIEEVKPKSKSGILNLGINLASEV